MTPQDRHQKVKELLNAAMELPPSERPAYLAQACEGDRSLQQEVEDLLAEDQTEQFSDALRAKVSQQAAEAFRQKSDGGLIGTLVHQRYRIEKELGRGGIGVVYLARDEQVHGRQVVLKTLLAGSDASPWLLGKFRHESEALARIDHPGVVKVLDLGEMEHKKPFFVMEYVKGETVRSVVTAEGVDLELVAHIVRQLGQALGAAHDESVVHRDLKPDNIMLQSLSGNVKQVKLIDFGIAKVKDPKSGDSTGGPMTAGTVLYMAPEQMLDGESSPQSDIYSFGAVAYELVTGRKPFMPEAADTLVMMRQILEMQESGVKLKPKDLRPRIPEAAQAAILKALSYRPEDRYHRVWEFGDELANALLGEPGTRNTRQATESIVIETKPGETGSASQAVTLKVAHILFTDIVGYSKLPATEQVKVIQGLQQIVRDSASYRQAQTQNKLISLPTGDGMALAFFSDPTAPVQCAMEIATALQNAPQIKLRMGVHTGPVYTVSDINGKPNVSGGGINIAQRVMDCGDAGHILLSKTTAEMITQLGIWSPEYFNDLGEYTVKHGVKVHLVNLATGKLGNVAAPNKPKAKPEEELLPTQPAKLPIGDTLPQPPPIPFPASPKPQSANAFKFVMAAVAAIVLMVGGYFALKPTPPKIERQLNYSVLVQGVELDKNGNWKFDKDGKPIPRGEPNPMYGDLNSTILFRNDDGIQLMVHSPQAGYLYLLNEAPKPRDDGKPKYTVMFPSTLDNNGNALLPANSSTKVPNNDWIGFFGSTGTEKMWLVWADKVVPDLEAVKGLNNPKVRGVIQDPTQIDAVQKVLNANRPKPDVQKDDTAKETRIRGEGDTLVYLVTLVHR